MIIWATRMMSAIILIMLDSFTSLHMAASAFIDAAAPHLLPDVEKAAAFIKKHDLDKDGELSVEELNPVGEELVVGELKVGERKGVMERRAG